MDKDAQGHFEGCWWPTEPGSWEVTILASGMSDAHDAMADRYDDARDIMAGISSEAHERPGMVVLPSWPTHGSGLTAVWNAVLGWIRTESCRKRCPSSQHHRAEMRPQQ